MIEIISIAIAMLVPTIIIFFLLDRIESWINPRNFHVKTEHFWAITSAILLYFTLLKLML